jgi:hypothetical protein
MAFFDLDELNVESAPSAGSGILKDKFLDVHLAKVESIKDLNGRLPGEGEIFFLWTLNSFNAFTFIPYMIKSNGNIEELIISTYSISTRILNALIHYIEKRKIEKCHIMISDSIKFRLPKVQEQILYYVGRNPAFTVSYGWNHSKICLMGTRDGHFVVEGSVNFSENAQYEQYVFVNSSKIFEFRKNMIHGIQPGSKT